jgi:hypothetical protein
VAADDLASGGKGKAKALFDARDRQQVRMLEHQRLRPPLILATSPRKTR